MQILIATPKQKNKTQGNQFRWAKLLKECGHQVTVTSEPDPDEIANAGPETLIALHATHNASTIARTAKEFPQVAIVVIMTGTDLNIDLAKDPSS